MPLVMWKKQFNVILFAKIKKSQVPKSHRFAIDFSIGFSIKLGAFSSHCSFFFDIYFCIYFPGFFFQTSAGKLLHLYTLLGPGGRPRIENGHQNGPSGLTCTPYFGTLGTLPRSTTPRAPFWDQFRSPQAPFSCFFSRCRYPFGHLLSLMFYVFLYIFSTDFT